MMNCNILLFISVFSLSLFSACAQQSLSLEEVREIALLRNSLADIQELRPDSPHRFSDMHLSRWIKFYDNDTQEAEAKFRTCEKWLTKYDFHDLPTWEPSETIKKALPYEIIGITPEGVTVADFPLGIWDVKTIVLNGGGRGSNDVVKRFAQMFDKIAELEATPPGNDSLVGGRSYFIADLKGFNYEQIATPKETITIIRIMLYLDRCQPFGLLHCFAPRASASFRSVWNIITRMLNQKTIDSFSILSRFQNWKDPLYDAIPKHLIPESLGGTHQTNYNLY